MKTVPAWLGALEIPSKDPGALAAFLREVLAVELDEPGPDGVRAGFLGELRLIVSPGEGAGGARPVVIVEDLVGVAERARSGGGTVLAGPRRDGDGAWVEVEAPDGSRWILRSLSEIALKERRARRHRHGVIPDLGLDWPGPRRP